MVLPQIFMRNAGPEALPKFYQATSLMLTLTQTFMVLLHTFMRNTVRLEALLFLHQVAQLRPAVSTTAID